MTKSEVKENIPGIRFKQLTRYLHQLSSETTFLNWRARDWTEHSVDVMYSALNVLCDTVQTMFGLG